MTTTYGLPQPPAALDMLPADALGGSTALVTSAGTKLAQAAAMALGRAGVRLVLADPGDSPLGCEALLDQYGITWHRIRDDAQDDVAMARLYDVAEAVAGPIDLLVNAGIGLTRTDTASLTYRDWYKVTRRLLDRAFLLTAEFGRRRLEQGGGSVLHLTESFAWTGIPRSAHAAAAYAGINAMVQSLAVEWAPHDIRVNAIAPGPFAGGDVAERLGLVEDGMAQTLPALRLGQPKEFGWAVSYLSSPYAAYVTGAFFVIDGGSWLRRNLLDPTIAARTAAAMTASA